MGDHLGRFHPIAGAVRPRCAATPTKVPLVFLATDEPIFFLRFCADCLLWVRAIAQASSAGGGTISCTVSPIIQRRKASGR